MKKNFLLISIGFFCLNISLFGQDEIPKSLQDPIIESKKLGLASYLTTLKAMSEYKMISLLTDDGYKKYPEKAKEFQSEYNQLKLSIDEFINQLSVDLITHNKLNVYKKLDCYIKKGNTHFPKRFMSYKDFIDDINKKEIDFLLNTYSSTKAIPLIDEILGIVELTHGIITDARDFREKKVTNLISQIKDLKLKSLKDLIEPTEKEK